MPLLTQVQILFDLLITIISLFRQRRRLFPFLLLPAQALCYGDLERDGWPVQYCASQGMELLCAQAFSHCFGLYGERVGLRKFLPLRISVSLLWLKGTHKCENKLVPQIKTRSQNAAQSKISKSISI